MWLVTAWSHWGRMKSWFNKSGIHTETGEEKQTEVHRGKRTVEAESGVTPLQAEGY